jgi:hypothetical protein
MKATKPAQSLDLIILPEVLTVWILNSVLIIGFFLVYMRVKKGSQIPLVSTICIYLIIANLGGIIWAIFYYINRV